MGWVTTRPNGAPLEAGTVCWESVMPGINPIYVYGKSEQEVIEKLDRNAATAQAALARRSAAAATPATGLPPAAAPTRMSGDDRMRATLDLADPSKSGTAAVRLIEDATGINLGDMVLDRFGRLAMDWQRAHPDFYAHPGNKNQLVTRAKAYAGGDLSRVTAEMLTQAFETLDAEGKLFEAPQEPAAAGEPTPDNLTTFPGGSQVQRTERPRGALFATGVRSTSFRAAQTAQPRTPKYTAKAIQDMSDSESRRLIETNDKDYADSVEYHFGQRTTA